MQRRIDLEARGRAAEAVVERRVFDVVPGREAFKLRPAHPGGRHRAGFAGLLQSAGGLFNLLPGARKLVRFGRKTRVLELREVEIENRGRRVEGVAHHAAVGRRVVAEHGRDVLFRMEFVARLFHEVAHGNDRSLAEHHRGGADFKDLQDVGGASRAVRGDARGHRLVVGALIRRNESAFLLRLVVLLRDVGHPVAERIGHGMPHRDFGGRRQGGAGAQGARGGKGGNNGLADHLSVPSVHFLSGRRRPPDRKTIPRRTTHPYRRKGGLLGEAASHSMKNERRTSPTLAAEPRKRHGTV